MRVNLESTFTGECLRSRKVVLSNRALSDPRIDPAICQGGLKAVVAVPILENDAVLGVLVVFSTSEESFEDKHIASCRCLALLICRAAAEFRMHNNNMVPGDQVREPERLPWIEDFLKERALGQEPLDELGADQKCGFTPALTDLLDGLGADHEEENAEFDKDRHACLSQELFKKQPEPIGNESR
jgi:hypothetical protein